MKKIIGLVLVLCMLFTVPVSAACTHTVVSGDTLWKIACRYKIGLSEIISANKSLNNPNRINVGDKIEVPSVDEGVDSYEAEVIRLVNEIRQSYGLGTLTANWELSRVARYKSQDMHDRKYFSHTSPT